jgi:DMSO/TMAO reductase YedYZ heme-binding membrane subunit
MSLLISLILVLAFALLLRKPIKRFPALFYLLAILICSGGIYFTIASNPNQIVRTLAFAVQKGHLGFSMFALVMFIGVFERGSSVRRMLNPIRAQLSIIASILILGHLIPYLRNYLGMMGSLFSLNVNLIISIVIAFILLILLFVLAATSFDAIKQKMSAVSWKKIQWFAYPFFGLIYFHLLGFLLIPALHGSLNSLINLVVYSVLFISYAVLRIKRGKGREPEK